MAEELRDNRGEQRYELWSDGRLTAHLVYRIRPGLIALIHTETEPGFEGEGAASRLVRGALDRARADGNAVLPFCPFANEWISRHPEYADLVPASNRESFGLG
ncbi:MAG: GNAT family N-acetyltransferase [Solirubrobacterales bacterium]